MNIRQCFSILNVRVTCPPTYRVCLSRECILCDTILWHGTSSLITDFQSNKLQRLYKLLESAHKNPNFQIWISYGKFSHSHYERLALSKAAAFEFLKCLDNAIPHTATAPYRTNTTPHQQNTLHQYYTTSHQHQQHALTNDNAYIPEQRE